jgi:hypothetical protein
VKPENSSLSSLNRINDDDAESWLILQQKIHLEPSQDHSIKRDLDILDFKGVFLPFKTQNYM